MDDPPGDGPGSGHGLFSVHPLIVEAGLMRQPLRWVFLACLATFGSMRSAEARVENSPSASRPIVAVDGRLRSGFLLRASGMDQRAPAKSDAERVARLQRHFAVVLAILVESTDASLEIALDRLQSHRGEHWTADERAGWWKRLATERLVNLQRLRRYAARGVFPMNEHVADRAVP